jgi:hypothetical protein
VSAALLEPAFVHDLLTVRSGVEVLLTRLHVPGECARAEKLKLWKVLFESRLLCMLPRSPWHVFPFLG